MFLGRHEESSGELSFGLVTHFIYLFIHFVVQILIRDSGGEHLKKGHGVPETTGMKEGAASRNIQRKSDHNHGYVINNERNIDVTVRQE